MYLTAQRVQSKDARQGINAYLNWHGAGDGRELPWQGPADSWNLGTPSEYHPPLEQIPPGGNAVRSYLDIFAPDDVNPNEVTAAVLQLLTELEPAKLPARHTVGRVQFEFGMDRALAAAWKAEVQHLFHECLQVWTRTRA
jgi:hypothetical protein